jgi:hypothetical protein
MESSVMASFNVSMGNPVEGFAGVTLSIIVWKLQTLAGYKKRQSARASGVGSGGRSDSGSILFSEKLDLAIVGLSL